jgi:hypothetical protein
MVREDDRRAARGPSFAASSPGIGTGTEKSLPLKC